MLALKESREVARPLKVLVPLIKDELAAGDRAGMAHYRKAGEMLNEAKAQVEHGEWTNWVINNFRLSLTTANVYMRLAREPEKKGNLFFANQTEFIRTTAPDYNKHVSSQPWHEPVKQAMDDPALVERLRQDTQRRTDESKMARDLGLKLIDIGYKVLATKLHPDKGGSKTAMERLNYVRDRLKKALPL